MAYDSFGTDDAELSGGMGAIEPEYVPSWLLGGQGGWPGMDQPASGSSPTKVALYMSHLRTLGYSAPDMGNPRDPEVMQVVASFQAANQPAAGVIDGLVGPTFYALVDAQIAGRAVPGVPVAPSFDVPGPSPGPLLPVVDRPSDSNLGLWIGLGVVGVVGAGVAWYVWGS